MAKTPKQVVDSLTKETRDQRIARQKREIVSLITEGESLRAICKSDDMPAISTVMEWLNEDSVFSEHYTRAREAYADAVFDELDEVSDAAVTAGTAVEVAGLRLKADNMKWKLARMNAKKYGDKVSTEITGANGGAVKVDMSIGPDEAYLKMIGK